MKAVIFSFLFITSILIMEQKPSMEKWTILWREADLEKFQNLYARNAALFPAQKPAIIGNKNIADFMKGGIGKVDVFFEATSRTMSNSLAFEIGVFKDVELGAAQVLAEGNYSITWVLEAGEWKILCHTWSMQPKN